MAQKEIENIHLTEGMVLEHSHWTSGQLTCRAAEAESTRRWPGGGDADPLDAANTEQLSAAVAIDA